MNTHLGLRPKAQRPEPKREQKLTLSTGLNFSLFDKFNQYRNLINH